MGTHTDVEKARRLAKDDQHERQSVSVSSMNAELYWPIWLKILAPIVLVLETILGICLNVSILLTPFSKKHLQGNFFVKDLAVTNLFVSAIIPPLLTVVILLPVFRFHAFVIVEGLLCFTVVSNCVSVTCISIDRYMSIVKLENLNRKTRYPRTVIWSLSLLGFALPFAAYTILDISDTQDCYIFKCRHVLHVLKPYFLYELYFTLIFTVASITVIACYKYVYQVAIRRIKVKIHVTNTKNKEQHFGLSKLRRFRRVTKITICIVVSFLICWTPLIVVSWILVFESDNNQTSRVAHIITTMVAMLSNILNPILYTFVRPPAYPKSKTKQKSLKVMRNSSKVAPQTTLEVHASFTMERSPRLLVPPSQDLITSSFSGSSFEKFTNSDCPSVDVISVQNITNHFEKDDCEFSQ